MKRVWLFSLLLGCSSGELPLPASSIAQSPPTKKLGASTMSASEPVIKPDPAGYVSLMEGLAELSRAQKDCAALAADLKGYHAEHKAALQGASPALLKELEYNAPLRERMRNAMSALMTTSLKCQQEPSFQWMKELSL
jgi:hypothetical protein